MKKEERIEWIDIAKGIGILLMIYGHVFKNIYTDVIYLFSYAIIRIFIRICFLM